MFEAGADAKSKTHSCKKNPGHVKFIAVENFNASYLPDNYRNAEVMDAIRALADVTVKIKVNYVSLNRPATSRLVSSGYPFYKDRGKKTMTTGTGRIWSVHKTPENQIDMCHCGRCRSSDTPKKMYGVIVVVTATHVIFDETEAKTAKCLLEFNNSTKELQGWGMNESNPKDDRCFFNCVTCDAELFHVVETMADRFDRLRYDVTLIFKERKLLDKLVVMASHPHGGPKKISVGKWTRECHEGNRRSAYVHTACTCPGSSGATLFMLGFDGTYPHCHCGANSEGNFSVVV